MFLAFLFFPSILLNVHRNVFSVRDERDRDIEWHARAGGEWRRTRKWRERS